MQPTVVPSVAFRKTRDKGQRLPGQARAMSNSAELISAGGPARRKRYFEASVESRASVLDHKTPFLPGHPPAPRSALKTHFPGKKILRDNTRGMKGAAEISAGADGTLAGFVCREAGGAQTWRGPLPPEPAPCPSSATTQSSINKLTHNNRVLLDRPLYMFILQEVFRAHLSCTSSRRADLRPFSLEGPERHCCVVTDARLCSSEGAVHVGCSPCGGLHPPDESVRLSRCWALSARCANLSGM